MENLRSPIVSSGKYKNETLRDIYQEDPYYCLIYLRYVEDHPEYKKFINQELVKFVNLWEENYAFQRKKQPVTEIVRTLSDYHINRLYNCLGNLVTFESRQVHDPTNFLDYVEENYKLHESFYSCLIRKHIFNLQNRNAVDSNVEYIIFEDHKFAEYKKDFEKFQDKQKNVKDILLLIYKLVLIEKMHKGHEEVKIDSSLIDEENIKKVLLYAESTIYLT